MKALIIKSPHIDNILLGEKIWELRGSATHIRGEIALIKSGSGMIIGYATLTNCIGPLSQEDLNSNIHLHMAPGVTKYKKTYAWVLSNARLLTEPIPYKHPQGAIIWVNV